MREALLIRGWGMFMDAIHLTSDEISFLNSQNLSIDDVYDGRNQYREYWMASVRAAGLTLVLGTPCRNGGHRLRTRSGHCVQCDTRKLAYQTRHHAPGFIYLAGSRSARLLKIGIATDIEQRGRQLRAEAYGNIRDWAMLFYARVQNGGKTEGDAIRRLKKFQVIRTYEKDRLPQDALELIETSSGKAISAIKASIAESNVRDIWKSPHWKEYDFKP